MRDEVLIKNMEKETKTGKFILRPWPMSDKPEWPQTTQVYKIPPTARERECFLMETY